MGFRFFMSDTAYRLDYYQQENGAIPFRDWLHDLRDRHGVERIRARLARVQAQTLVSGGALENVDNSKPS